VTISFQKKCRGSKLQVIAPLANGFPPKKETGTSLKINIQESKTFFKINQDL